MHGETRHIDPGFLTALAWAAVAGCAALILGTLVAQVVVPGHDWIADTISDLGAGRAEIVMDVALYGFAAGIFALALAAAHRHPGARRWSVGAVLLALTAALVVVVAARNEYGDRDSDGIVIHMWLVYGLGATFLAIPFLMARGAAEMWSPAGPLLRLLGLVWAVAAPVFLFLPTDVDGLYERGLGLVACAILCVLARALANRDTMVV